MSHREEPQKGFYPGTPVEEFDRAEGQVIARIGSLNTRLAEHRKEFEKEGSVRYGFTRDLEHIATLLDEILEGGFDYA